MSKITNESASVKENRTLEEVIGRLLEGNERFFHGRLDHKDIGHQKRSTLLKGQSPFAIVVTCSDSRVSPELIFDQTLGDLFVIRVAGNLIDALELASIEYAATHLNTRVLLLLAHTHCGAVTAAVESPETQEGNLKAVIKKLQPAVYKAKSIGSTREEIIEIAIKENLSLTEKEILANSPIIKELVEKGEFKIVKALYNMATGKVEIL